MSAGFEREHIERANSVDLASLVGRKVKLFRRGRSHWGCCPFHKDKTPSFKVENNRFHCFGCGADGDAIAWLRETEGLPFVEAVKSLTGLDPDKQPPNRSARGVEISSPVDADTMERVRLARAIWSSGASIIGTVAETYLRIRGILEPLNPSLRFVRAYRADGGVHPALVGALLSPGHTITAVQVTALRTDGTGKATINAPRKTFGVLGASAVRLAAATEILGLAEGVETGLSAMQLTGLPAWCCIGAGRMDRVQVPDSVQALHIFADDDAAGEEAAQKTAAANRRRRVIIRLPPDGGDWNDVVMRRAEGEMVEIPSVPG